MGLLFDRPYRNHRMNRKTAGYARSSVDSMNGIAGAHHASRWPHASANAQRADLLNDLVRENAHLCDRVCPCTSRANRFWQLAGPGAAWVVLLA